MRIRETPPGYWLFWLPWLPHPAKPRRYWVSMVATFLKAVVAVATEPATAVIGSQLVASGGYCETPVNTGLAAIGSQVAKVATPLPPEIVKCTINT